MTKERLYKTMKRFGMTMRKSDVTTAVPDRVGSLLRFR
jgi:hypothetical protein